MSSENMCGIVSPKLDHMRDQKLVVEYADERGLVVTGA
jgi:hypothetical protein